MESIKTLAIMTRVHPQRPNMLKKCVESVQAQTSEDYTHILHYDDKTVVGYGKRSANRAFAKIKDIPAKYVMVLDDDDMLIDPEFVEDFATMIETKKILFSRIPEIVFFKGIIHKLGALPRPAYWKKPPVYGQIGSFCFASRRDVWLKYITSFGMRELGGDYSYISTAYRNTKDHVWWDRIVARTQKGPGRAKGEKDHA